MRAIGKYAAYAFTIAVAPLAGLVSPARVADDNCGPGMYFNVENNQCQYYAIVGRLARAGGPRTRRTRTGRPRTRRTRTGRPRTVGPGPVGPGR